MVVPRGSPTADPRVSKTGEEEGSLERGRVGVRVVEGEAGSGWKTCANCAIWIN